MEFNAGNVDRAVRIILGLFIMALIFVGPKTPLGLLGIIPLATGIAGYCPLYRVLGISTCKVGHGKRAHRPAT